MSLVLDGLGPRDSLHVAAMCHHGVTRILTFDLAFDRVDGIERVT